MAINFKRNIALLLSVSLLLTACGDSRLERTGSGAAIGAGIGLGSGYLCCQNPGKGAEAGLFIGMAVGALIGFILDEPLFFNNSSR